MHPSGDVGGQESKYDGCATPRTAADDAAAGGGGFAESKLDIADADDYGDDPFSKLNVSTAVPPEAFVRPLSAPSPVTPHVPRSPSFSRGTSLSPRARLRHVDDRPIGKGRPGPMPADEDADPELEWLSQLWCEVEFLLRKPVTDEDTAQATMEATAASLAYLDRLAATAGRLEVLQGALSRAVLPFDSETSTQDQAAAAGQSDDPLLDRLTPKQLKALVTGATTMRSLVRVKVADDADLMSAREALTTVSSCFALLTARSTRLNCGLWAVIESITTM